MHVVSPFLDESEFDEGRVPPLKGEEPFDEDLLESEAKLESWETPFEAEFETDKDIEVKNDEELELEYEDEELELEYDNDDFEYEDDRDLGPDEYVDLEYGDADFEYEDDIDLAPDENVELSYENGGIDRELSDLEEAALVDVSEYVGEFGEVETVEAEELLETLYLGEGSALSKADTGVTFPSGAVLRIVQGDTSRDGEHWDPHGTGNPLLDTSDRSIRPAPNFTIGELATSGARRFNIARIDPNLVSCLQAIRNHAGRPVLVTSGYRSWAYNKAIYSRRNKKPTLSRHSSGQAADIKIRGMTGLDIAKRAIDVYGSRIGVGVGTDFAHIDVRGAEATWTYISGAAGRKALAEIRKYIRDYAQGRRTAYSPTQTTNVDIKRASWGGWRGLQSGGVNRYEFREDWQDLVLAAVGDVEGTFDKVNAYDRGILSWGISQWTAHAGSLLRVLRQVKERLGDARFADLFGGLDVTPQGFVFEERLYSGHDGDDSEVRILFRGTTSTTEFDDQRLRTWVRLFTIAGRQKDVHAVQRSVARSELLDQLQVDLGSIFEGIRRSCDKTTPKSKTQRMYWCRRLPESSAHYRQSYGLVRNYIRQDPVAVTLYYGMYVNNPTWARLEFKRAVDNVASTNGWSTKGQDWPIGSEVQMARELESVLRSSTIGMWGDANAKAKMRESRTQKLLASLARSRQ